MAQLNDTMVQGDLRVTGKIYGTDNAIRLENANLAIPPIGDGDYVGSTGDFFIGSGSGKNLPDNTNNFNIHTTVAHFTGTTYRLSQIATPTSSTNPTGIYERGGTSSDGITWAFGSWASYNNYTLPLAASGTRGGIQIGYSASGTNYAVKLSSEKAYVSVPWTDTKVTQTKDDSGTTAYPLLMAGAADPNGTATTSRYDSGVKLTPSTNTISANISGNAATATKINTSAKIGDTNKPVYIAADGTVTAINYTIATSVPSGAVFTDTKQNITLATTTKAFITGVSTTPTSTPQALAGLADTGVYLTTTAGQLHATTFDVNSKCTLQFDSTNDALDFMFA